MSKYTTQLRFICEQKAGLTESAGADDVDEIIEAAWDQIFTDKAPFFDEEYRPVLCQKILKHYYLREIGAETVGIWKMWMNERLEMIMPYYNQLYSSELIEFNPLYDVDVTREYAKGITGAEGSTGSATGAQGNTSWDLFSDTPQGAITNVDNNTYLTDARKVTDSGQSSSSFQNRKNTNTTEQYTETVLGKHGSGSFSSMLNEFRNTFLNIDAMVIEEFEDLFFGLW